MRRYFALMGTCLMLVVLSWVVVRPFSTTLSVVLGIVAMVIPPFAAIVANWDTGYGPDADDRRVDRRAATRLDRDPDDGGGEGRRGEG